MGNLTGSAMLPSSSASSPSTGTLAQLLGTGDCELLNYRHKAVGFLAGEIKEQEPAQEGCSELH